MAAGEGSVSAETETTSLAPPGGPSPLPVAGLPAPAAGPPPAHTGPPPAHAGCRPAAPFAGPAPAESALRPRASPHPAPGRRTPPSTSGQRPPRPPVAGRCHSCVKSPGTVQIPSRRTCSVFPELASGELADRAQFRETRPIRLFQPLIRTNQEISGTVFFLCTGNHLLSDNNGLRLRDQHPYVTPILATVICKSNIHGSFLF
uniref:Uncharacterized protein n=1 Tax=Setaria viridis TaxID=4556 RepID=A0A4U6WE35_SETVI|nr:hypothetical protein SEVIR_1G242700v2 [Setaria viridis]